MSLENAVQQILDLHIFDFIKRKLSYILQQEKMKWMRRNQRLLQDMQEQVVAGIHAEKIFNSHEDPALHYYDELCKGARDITQNWPSMAWQSMRPILDKTVINPTNLGDILDLIDTFSWRVRSREPFPLSYIDKEEFMATVMNLAKSYKMPNPLDDSRFMILLNQKSTAAQNELRVLARTSRVGIGLVVEEYFIERQAHSIYLNSNSNQGAQRNDGPDDSDPHLSNKSWFSRNARKAANARHDQPGGSREKQRAIQEIWESGKYTSKDRCAEEECGSLGISFATARKALRNIPEPKAA